MKAVLYTHGFLDLNGVAIHGRGTCRARYEPKQNNPALAILTLAHTYSLRDMGTI